MKTNALLLTPLKHLSSGGLDLRRPVRLSDRPNPPGLRGRQVFEAWPMVAAIGDPSCGFPASLAVSCKTPNDSKVKAAFRSLRKPPGKAALAFSFASTVFQRRWAGSASAGRFLPVSGSVWLLTTEAEVVASRLWPLEAASEEARWGLFRTPPRRPWLRSSVALMGCSFQASSWINSITGTFSSHFPVFV